MPEAKSTLGMYLTELRKNKGLKTCEVAKKAGLRTAYVHMLETDTAKSKIYDRALVKMASFYSTPVDLLFKKAHAQYINIQKKKMREEIEEEVEKKVEKRLMERLKKGMLTEKEAAAMLSLSPITLHNWRLYGYKCKGKGPVSVKLGKTIRYRIKDLREFVKECRTDNK